MAMVAWGSGGGWGRDGGCGRFPLYFVTLDAVWYQVASGWGRSGPERAGSVAG